MGGGIWLLVGAGFCLGSLKLKIGGLHNPGAGFIPFLVGVLLMAFGLIMILSFLFGFRTRREKNGKGEGGKEYLVNLRAPFLTLLILTGYVILLEPVGFLLTTFLCLFLLFKISDPKRWLLPVGLSLGTVVISYLVFSVWLKNPFPRGILGF